MPGKLKFLIIVLSVLQVNNSYAAYEPFVVENNYKIAGNYLSGSFARRSNSVSVAAEYFTKALKSDPDNPELLRSAYKLLLETGKVKKAVELAKKYKGFDSDYVPVNILLAINEIDRGDYKRAEEILEHISFTDGNIVISGIDLIILPFIKIWAKIGQKDYQSAQEILDILIKGSDSPLMFLTFQNALINDLAGNNEIAAEQYNKMVEKIKLAPYHFVQAAGNFYERTGRADKALDIYKSFRRYNEQYDYFFSNIENVSKGKLQDKRYVANAAQGVAAILLESVRAFYSANLYKEGLGYLRLATHLKPDNDETAVLLAAYFEENNSNEMAIQVLEGIKSGSDFYYGSQISIAENMYSMGDVQKAHKILNKIIRKNKKLQTALLTKADLYRREEKFAEAAKAYTQALEKMDLNNEGVWPIYFARGICYERIGRMSESESDLLTALRFKPDQPEVLNYLGYSWVDQNKNIDDAKQMIAKAVLARPDDAQIIDSMGWALYKLNEFDKASMYLERAVEIAPYDAVLNNHLGDIYWKQGRKNEAIYQWRRVLQYNNSSDISIDEVKSKIKKGIL